MTYDTNQLTRASAINMSIRRLLMEVATFDKSARSVSVPAVMNQMVTRGDDALSFAGDMTLLYQRNRTMEYNYIF